MARNSFKATIGQSLGGGQYVLRASSGGTATATVSTTQITTDNNAVIAALTAINSLAGFVALTGAVAAMSTATTAAAAVTTDIAALAPVAATSGDVTLSWDTTNITTMNQLRRAVDALLLLASGSGMV